MGSPLPRDTQRTATLDGLRGIAVLAVVIQHAWPAVLPGGFAGVDVFFVLSGFLITRILVNELGRTGTVDLVGFYARRVRRIIPASILCVLGTWLLFAILLGPAVPDDLSTQAAAANFSVSNILFARASTDYFAADAASSPYLHFWSLAVEEQFYLVWPGLLLGLTLLARRMRRATIRRWLPIVAVALIGLGSLGLALGGKQSDAFFLLPQRSWELIVGGLLAWLQRDGLTRLPASLDRYRPVGVVAGASALGLTFAAAPYLGPWPGPATVLAVLGAGLLVAGGDAMPGARAFTLPPLRFFGRISYALYLWHWPLLAASTLIALPAMPPPLLVTAAAVSLAVAIATASTRFVEEPIRSARMPLLVRRRAIGTALASVAVVGLAVTTLTGSIASTVTGDSALAGALASAKGDRERLIADKCFTNTTGSATPRDCAYGAAANPDGSPTHDGPGSLRVAVLFGDSHAMYWFPLVDAWAKDKGMALVPLVRSGCAPVDAPPTGTPSRQRSCLAWLQAALDRITDLQPVITFVSTSTGIPLDVDGVTLKPRVDPGRWVDLMAGMLAKVRERSRSVLLLGDVPRPGFSVPDCLAVHRADPSACARPVADAVPAGLVEAEARAAQLANVAFVDPGPWLCPDDVCTWMAGDRIGWVDDHHISSSNALRLRPLLQPVFDAVAGLQPTAAGPPGDR